jgi:DNA polymerase-3 subunit delta
MPDPKPTVYLLRGDDRQAIEKHLTHFYEELGEPDMADMNTTRLEGNQASLNDLREAALAIPFLANRRLVILEDALKIVPRSGKKEIQAAFLELLESLPQTTALTLVIPDERKYRRGREDWQSLNDNHWLIQWVNQSENRAYLIDCPLPSQQRMPAWVRAKAKAFGGSFTPQAANVLAEYVGTDTQRAVQEINKLLTYVNFDRPVDDDDVRRLTAQEQQGDIFALVDSIGNRNGQQALEMLHLLLEKSDPLALFGMIIRQFRLLLQAREILDNGGNQETVAKTLNQHGFVARKITVQAQKFSLKSLEGIHHHLLKIDLDMKTGGMPGDIALDILIARLAQ